MNRESCLQHAPKVRSVVIKSDYLEICANDHCAAALLGLIEFWANGALASEVNPPKKVKLGEFTSKDLHWWLLGFYSTKRIMERITMLKNRGWITYKDSANRKTRTYWANVPAIQAALNRLSGQMSSDKCLDYPRQMSTPDKCLQTNVSTTPDKCLDKAVLVETNVRSSIYSNFLSNSSFSKEERDGKKLDPDLNPEKLRTQDKAESLLLANQSPVEAKDPDPEPPPVPRHPPQPDNSGLGNVAPDGNKRAFNQMTGKWASCPLDPWMKNQNPLLEFKQWVCRRAIASNKPYSLADAAGEIRNNYQRASDLWEEYQEEQKRRQEAEQRRLDYGRREPTPPPTKIEPIEPPPQYWETLEDLRKKAAERKANWRG